MLSADRTTGEVPGTDRVRSSLVALGLAVHHGRRGAVYLTPAGHALRNAAEAPAPSVSVTDGPDGQGFRPATGDGPTLPLAPADRLREVERAWAGVMEIRRLNGDTTVPAPWELARMEWSVALALEAAGLPASQVDNRGQRARVGYRVTRSPGPDAARVEWRGPDAFAARRDAPTRLQDCRAALEQLGWAATLYQRSGGNHFLTVTPTPAPRA
ncbi:hypothetical protein [Kitasatospora herbaricolor]|uniref:hypothetical protein n=1 Tax=Kitasatospora herbaricolor TaxID=68217 RepID=UPI0036D800CF